ncbi:ATP-binding protein [Methylibium petroleiphilum]|uniref:ATP-binding protein n=1 Tax=Methylibium petroleiphilum TaxID=105560 RepID=UPI003D2BFCFC
MAAMKLGKILRPGSWSYRVKVPLLIAMISVLSALAISAAIAVSARHWLREDLHEHANAVAQSLARGLVVHIARDDVWEAFEAVRAVTLADGNDPRCEVVVLDRNQLVFVSSDPVRFGIRAPTTMLDEPLQHAARLATRPGGVALGEVRSQGENYAIVSMPLLSADKELVGTLLMSWSHAVFAQRYRDTIATLAAIAVGLVLVLIPFGWWLGHRVARPVARVTEALYRLGEDAAAKSSAFAAAAPTDPTQLVPASELDRLEHSLAQLQRQLDDKDKLQQQFIAADRLAAIGRMTAGVAHEINNPLAGMLNALSNLRRDPSLSAKTMALLERGLEQIRQTLSALLIETRSTHRPLSPSDIEDLRVLVLPQAEHKRLHLAWHYPVTDELPLPAAPVRQVALNLLLNAVQAAATKVEFSAGVEQDKLRLLVLNDGPAFPADRQAIPFEPVVGGEGNGLGLWASHQLVTSLGGSITLSVEDGQTRFDVHLPLHPLPVTDSIEPQHHPARASA